MATLALPTPAQRTSLPRHAARVCRNGHVASDALSPSVALDASTNRADPLSVGTDVTCAECGVATIVACPGCGYPIPGAEPPRAWRVPHFCVVCGEYYPWTFLGEFYTTLAEIIEESPRLADDPRAAHRALNLLDRQREGAATPAEVASLTDTFRSLGGSDWDLAAQILTVVLPPDARATLDLRGAFSV